MQRRWHAEDWVPVNVCLAVHAASHTKPRWLGRHRTKHPLVDLEDLSPRQSADRIEGSSSPNGRDLVICIWDIRVLQDRNSSQKSQGENHVESEEE